MISAMQVPVDIGNRKREMRRARAQEAKPGTIRMGEVGLATAVVYLASLRPRGL
jgi:hypothetical protein